MKSLLFRRIWVSLLFGAVFLLPIALTAQQALPAISPGTAEKKEQAVRLPPGYSLSRAQVRTVDLGALTNVPRTSRRNLNRVGVRREIPADIWDRATVQTIAGGGKIYRLKIESPGAKGIRFHFSDFSAESGEVWIYPTSKNGTNILGPFTGKGPMGDGDFWTGTIHAASAIVEYTAAAGTSGIPFHLDSIVHRWADLSTYLAPPNDPTAASCELDVSCYPSWTQSATGVVVYTFTDETGSSFVCSGSMIITAAQTFTPYLLTAHHCVDDDFQARSVEAVFLFTTPACNGVPPDITTLPTVTGAHYLTGAAIPGGDFAMMRLSSGGPSGVYFLGWNANDPTFTEALTGVHHPNGSWTRVSFGNRIADEDISIDGVVGPANAFYQVHLTKGFTEPGSSGSPLLNSTGQIYGTLTGGPPDAEGEHTCTITPFDITYGRFSVAYTYLAPYLSDSTSAAVNGASFLAGGAPGMVVSVFGTGLATGTQLAGTLPLPTNMQGTTATVNGVIAPLYYVSPGQVNLQIPYETAAGSATIVIRSGSGQTSTQTLQVSAASPGIFTTSDGAHRLVPNTSAARGTTISLYMTGQGAVSPAIANGAAPALSTPLSGLPAPVQNVAVYVGGFQALTTFVGIPYYLVGTTQINFIVPRGVEKGDQTVVVTVGDVVSGTAILTVQ